MCSYVMSSLVSIHGTILAPHSLNVLNGIRGLLRFSLERDRSRDCTHDYPTCWQGIFVVCHWLGTLH